MLVSRPTYFRSGLIRVNDGNSMSVRTQDPASTYPDPGRTSYLSNCLNLVTVKWESSSPWVGPEQSGVFTELESDTHVLEASKA